MAYALFSPRQRSARSSHIKPPSQFVSFPADLLLEIASYLDRIDVLSLCYTVRLSASSLPLDL
jgi:hypothetical protein